jgi:Ala-tRNA(Pro) deacylase
MMRVPDLLSEHDVRFETLVHAPAFTAQKRARRLHIPGKYLAKSVLLAYQGRFTLAVLPATHHVDFDALISAFGGRPRLATDEEVAEVFRDCEWGVCVPFGRLYGVPTLLDTSFAPDSCLVFEAHFHALTIRMSCRDFERLENPRRLSFARPQP